jgi:hypothetical protein
MSKRGRVKLVVDKAEFQGVIMALEAVQAFTSQRELWEAVCQTEWARGLRPRRLTIQVAMLRAKELGIVIRTPPGKRYDIAHHHTKEPRQRRKVDPDSIAALRRETPASLHTRVDKVAEGSLSSAIALKCLECCAYQKSEIRECINKDCPLWNFRPYQRKAA